MTRSHLRMTGGSDRPNPLTDPARQPPDMVAICCTWCGEWLAWCNPPPPPVPVQCPDCQQADPEGAR
jgi:hypothetical protein